MTEAVPLSEVNLGAKEADDGPSKSDAAKPDDKVNVAASVVNDCLSLLNAPAAMLVTDDSACGDEAKTSDQGRSQKSTPSGTPGENETPSKVTQPVSFLRPGQRRQYGLIGRLAFLRPSGCLETRYEPNLATCSPEEAAFLKRFILKTDAEYDAIEQMEQGTPEWKASRRYRVTGSTFATACDQNPYQTKAELVQEMLVSTFNGNEATERGTRLEPIACAEFFRVAWAAIVGDLRAARQEKRAVLRWADREFPIPSRFLTMDDATFTALDQKQIFEIKHTALVVCRRYPWIACSPDGVLFLFGVKVGVLEIKAPAKDQPYPAIPTYYWNQIAGNAFIQDISFTVFCVYTESRGVFLSYLETDHEYNTEFLLPNLSFFWWKHFLPRAIEFQNKLDANPADPSVLQQPPPPTLPTRPRSSLHSLFSKPLATSRSTATARSISLRPPPATNKPTPSAKTPWPKPMSAAFFKKQKPEP